MTRAESIQKRQDRQNLWIIQMAERECGFAPFVFRLHGGTPQVVREVLLERGWEEYDEEEQEEGDWNLYWRSSGFRLSDYENILPWQRLNHHPKISHITRKDCLVRNLRRMKSAFGATLYGFTPAAFILPNEYTKFLGVYMNNHTSRYWICKPVDLSRGRGIFLFEDIKDLVYDCSVIIQRYISNPLLISGYKFDLRIYVCIKSFSPLVIYMHQEGLVRFATEKYTLDSLHNPYSHLTNTSINKFGLCYSMDKEQVGKGCKWTLSKFRCFLHRQDVNELLLWHRISKIVTLTLLTAIPCVPSSPNCLELLGFDILIDSSFKPWLLEVNHGPALSLDCAADVTVKKGLISDFIDLMSYRMIDSLRQKGYLRKRYTRSSGRELRPKISQEFLLHGRKRSSAPSGSQNTMSLCPIHSISKSSQRLEKIGINDLKLTSTRNKPYSMCKLPSLDNKLKSAAVPWNRRTQDRGIPPCRVGDFILTFPFNEATLKASQDEVDVKTIVNELQNLSSRLTSSFTAKEEMRTGRTQSSRAVTDKFEALLWGPKYPPLLSECCSFGSDGK